METIKLIEPIFAKKTWGNNQAIKEFLGKDPGFKENIGEIFLASGLLDIIGGSTKIEGKLLRDLYANENIRSYWFGSVFKNTDEFPLLLKFLAVNEPLSLQVHPGDEFLGNKRIPGKTEGWWAASDSQVLLGFKKGFSEKDFKKLIADNYFAKKHSVKDLEQFLNLIELKKGEAVYVESGTIHTILQGNLIEPQQPCNTTYRIYDWGRNSADRPLQLDKALSVLKYDSRPQKIAGDGIFLDNQNFKIEHILVKDTFKKPLDTTRFHLILPLSKSIKANEIYIPGGQCALIPANTEMVYIEVEQATDIFITSAK